MYMMFMMEEEALDMGSQQVQHSMGFDDVTRVGKDRAAECMTAVISISYLRRRSMLIAKRTKERNLLCFWDVF